MIRKNYKKIILLSLVLILTIFSLPKKANAVLPVIDAGNIAQSIITATNSGVSSASEYSIQLKEFVLDGLLNMLVKQIVRQITASVVNWINSGFEGSPAFVTDPGSFFLDVADQTTGAFLSKYGGPLTDLCSPFSIDIRLALAFKYHPNNLKRYTCTLGAIIKNSKNAVAGASINGFTAGDFRQGGWPAFVSLTTEPQNNVIGAYLEADDELSIRVANAQLQVKDELNQGRGFLSWKKCTETGVQTNGDVAALTEGTDSGVENTPAVTGNVKSCKTETPGSVIAGSLDAHLSGPLRELELADEINEVVNALFAQLTTQVLTKGLRAVSGSGPSDSTAYITQIQNEASAGNTDQVVALKNGILNGIDKYIDNLKQFKANKDASLQVYLNVKKSYDDAKVCYQTKLNTYDQTLGASQKADLLSRMADIDSIVATNITPKASILLVNAQSADAGLQKLVDIKTAATTAKTVNDLNKPSQDYQDIVSGGNLITASEISTSKDELDQAKVDMDPFAQDALRKMQSCQVYQIGGIIGR